jgi:outer membrane protein TolC
MTDRLAQVRNTLSSQRGRPEYEQFDRARDRAASQQAVTKATDRPQVLAFGRAGFGRPGLNFISDQPQVYALAGVQLNWKAWNWGTSDREREAIALQQRIVSAEEAAFTSGLRRAIESDLATIDQLEASLPADERIVSLRESIDRTARVRLDEGVITASEYLDRHTEWLTAQFDRARHRVELAQARARVLTTLGLEVQ